MLFHTDALLVGRVDVFVFLIHALQKLPSSKVLNLRFELMVEVLLPSLGYPGFLEVIDFGGCVDVPWIVDDLGLVLQRQP